MEKTLKHCNTYVIYQHRHDDDILIDDGWLAGWIDRQTDDRQSRQTETQIARYSSKALQMIGDDNLADNLADNQVEILETIVLALLKLFISKIH